MQSFLHYPSPERMREEGGTEKNIVVLTRSDVRTWDGKVFMPNTIEMAQLKKPERGQFKTKVQISSDMSAADIKRILEEIFPFLEHKRFYCAAAVDNRTRLDFKGEHRIWDGQFVKRTLKSNSVLYIFADFEMSDCNSSSDEGYSSHGISTTSGRLMSNGDANCSKDFYIAAESANSAFPGGISTGSHLDGTTSAGDDITPDGSIPSQMPDSGLEEMDLLGVVQNINPPSGSVKGGFPFYVHLTEQLQDEDTSGVVKFGGVADVMVQKLNPFTLSGIVPPCHEPGEVPVTAVTQAGKLLGRTWFRYVDEMHEVLSQLVQDPLRLRMILRELVKNPAQLQALLSANWSPEHVSLGTDSNIAQILDPLNIQGQDNAGQMKQEQLLKVLQLLIYTAAETDAQQFIEMIFSTSVGQFVFNSYKDRKPLPKDVARANGHEDLAQYLEDVNSRLTKETSNDVQPSEIDWLEFMKAVQKQALVAQEKSSKLLKQPSESDDNSSDYFADAETSSRGSFEVDADWSDSEDKKSNNKEPCKEDRVSNQGPIQRLPTSEEGLPNEIPVKKEEQSDNKEKVSRWGFNFSLPEWLSKWRKRGDASPMQQGSQMAEEGKTESPSIKSSPGVSFSRLSSKGDSDCERSVHGTSETRRARPKVYGKCNHVRSSRRTEPAFVYKGIVFTCALLTVLAGIKLGEGRILHWAVGNGDTRISKLLLHCGLYVDAPGYLKETPLHVASKSGFLDLVDVLIQNGGNVNARNHPWQETPLHLAAQNGHQHIAQFLLRRGSQINAKRVPRQETPLHLAAQNGHKQVADVLLQHGSDVNARNFPLQETPLHLAARNGHQHIAEFLLQHGSQVNAKSFPWQETPLHLATKNGHTQTAEVLIQHGSDVNSRDDLEQTPLHQAALHGHKRLAEGLVGNGSDVNCGLPTPLHLAAQSGHKDISKFLLQRGSDVNAKSVPRQDPVLLCLCFSLSQCDCRLKLHHLDQQESTPLHLAAKNDHKHVAEDLIRHGGNVNAVDKSGQSPLDLAAQHGHIQTVEVLLQHGSDVNSGWKTPLNLAAHSGHKEIFVPLLETILHLLAANGHTHGLEVFIQHGGGVNVKNVPFQEKPFYLAAKYGHCCVAELLLEHGSVVNATNFLTSLHLAAEKVRRQTASKEEVFARNKFEEVKQKQTHCEQISWYLRDGCQVDEISQTVFYLATDNKHCRFPRADSSADCNCLQKASAHVQTTSRPHVRQANHLHAIIWIDISNKTSLAFSKRKSFSPRCQALSDFVREPMGEGDHTCQIRKEKHCKDDLNHSKFLAMCDNVDSCMVVDPSAGKRNKLVRVAIVMTPMKCSKNDVNRNSVLAVCISSSDPCVADSSEIKAGQVLSFRGLVCGLTGYYTKDSLLHSYNNYTSQCRTVVITTLLTFFLFVIIIIVLGWSWFQRRTTILYLFQQGFVSSKTCEPHVKDLQLKELLMEEQCMEEAQKCCTTSLINEHNEDLGDLPVEEVRMERLKSWLMQDLDVEEQSSLEKKLPVAEASHQVLVVGRPGVGKTSFCPKFLPAWATKQVVQFTLTTGMTIAEFNLLLFKIANEITYDELVKMKSLCVDDLPKGGLDSIENPRELFNFLGEIGKIGVDDLSYLVSLLEDIGNIQLANIVKELGLTGKHKSPLPFLLPIPRRIPNVILHQMAYDEIVSHIRSESTRIVSIYGSPGCGKSSVANTVARDLHSPELPVYFLSVQGLRSKAELTSKLLSVVKQPASNDESLTSSLSVDEQVFQQFTKFSDRCVLVLDNADELLGSGLSNVKAEVMELLEELLMRNRNLTLVVTTLETLECLNLLLQDLKAVRIGPLDEALKLKLANVSDSIKTMRSCISDGIVEQMNIAQLSMSLDEFTECLNNSLLKIRGLPVTDPSVKELEFIITNANEQLDSLRLELQHALHKNVTSASSRGGAVACIAVPAIFWVDYGAAVGAASAAFGMGNSGAAIGCAVALVSTALRKLGDDIETDRSTTTVTLRAGKGKSDLEDYQTATGRNRQTVKRTLREKEKSRIKFCSGGN